MAKEIGKRKIIIWVLVSVLVATVAGVLAYRFFGQTATPIPEQVTSQADFPVYYPSRVPNGYTLKTESVGGTSDTVHYTFARDSQNTEVSVTLQKIPANFDASKLIGGTSIPTSIVESGTLYNLSTGGSSKYMLNTGDGTLIFLTSSGAIATKDLNTIVNSLEQIKNK